MSVGQRNFSINGTHRNVGGVGISQLGRFLPKPNMVGNTQRGYGGCCGTYVVGGVIQSVTCTTEDPSVIKASVLDYQGMIATKYRWIRRPQPYAVVKPDSTLNNNTGGQYTDILSRTTIYQVSQCKVPSAASPSCSTTLSPLFTKSTNYQQVSKHALPSCTITKDPETYLSMDASDLIARQSNRCDLNNEKFARPILGAPVVSHA